MEIMMFHDRAVDDLPKLNINVISTVDDGAVRYTVDRQIFNTVKFELMRLLFILPANVLTVLSPIVTTDYRYFVCSSTNNKRISGALRPASYWLGDGERQEIQSAKINVWDNTNSVTSCNAQIGRQFGLPNLANGTFLFNQVLVQSDS